MSTILANSVQQLRPGSSKAATISKADAGSTMALSAKFARNRTLHSTSNDSSSSDTDSRSPPLLTFSSSASSSDTMTESDATHSPEEEGNMAWFSKSSSNQHTPLVASNEIDPYIDEPITPRPCLINKLSHLSLKLSDLETEDDAGYESGKEGGRRLIAGIGRPKLSRAESFQRRGSAQAMQQYRQMNLMRASPLNTNPTSAPATPTGKSSGGLTRPARPTRIELPFNATSNVAKSVTHQSNIGLGIGMPSSKSFPAQLQARERVVSNSRAKDSLPSPALTSETLSMSPPPKPLLRPVILDRRPSVIDDIPPLLSGTSNSTSALDSSMNNASLPAHFKGIDDEAPVSVMAFLTRATNGNSRKSGKYNTKKMYKDASREVSVISPN